MKTFRLGLIVLLIAAVSTAHAVGLLDSDTELPMCNRIKPSLAG